MRHITAAALTAALMSTSALAQDADTTEDSQDTMSETTEAAAADPFLWLEEVEGERALTQVREWNSGTLDTLKANPLYEELYNEALAIVNSEDKIAYPSQRGDHVYNFWQDETHVKGVSSCQKL